MVPMLHQVYGRKSVASSRVDSCFKINPNRRRLITTIIPSNTVSPSRWIASITGNAYLEPRIAAPIQESSHHLKKGSKSLIRSKVISHVAAGDNDADPHDDGKPACESGL